MEGSGVVERVITLIDNFQKELENVKIQLDVAKNDLIKQKAALDRERKKFEEEKKLVEDFNLQTQDQINLNVGGTLISTTKSTLRSIPDTVLDVMFSGRHKLTLDKEQHYFIDRDPKVFRYLLNYLRSYKESQIDVRPSNFPLQPPAELLQAVIDEFDYFCIHVPSSISPNPHVNFLSLLSNPNFRCVDKIPLEFVKEKVFLFGVQIVKNKVLAYGNPRDFGGVVVVDLDKKIAVTELFQEMIAYADLDGSTLVAAAGLHVYITDLITKHQITVERAHKNWIFYAKIHNGKIITCSKTTIKIWDLHSGAFLRQLQGHGGPVNCLDVSNDFVISGSTDKTIKIWGLDTGECLSTLDIKREVSCVRYLNDMVICGVDTVIEIWDIPQAKCVSVIDVSAPVSCLCVINGVIVSGSTTGDVQLWNIETGKCGQILKHGDKIRSITITEDNTLITVSSDYVLKIWKG